MSCLQIHSIQIQGGHITGIKYRIFVSSAHDRDISRKSQIYSLPFPRSVVFEAPPLCIFFFGMASHLFPCMCRVIKNTFDKWLDSSPCCHRQNVPNPGQLSSLSLCHFHHKLTTLQFLTLLICLVNSHPVWISKDQQRSLAIRLVLSQYSGPVPLFLCFVPNLYLLS